MSVSTSVYRTYGAGSKLLYIGCSGNVKKRFQQHKYSSFWHPYMIHHKVRVYPTRERALAVEARAIRWLKPKFNNDREKRIKRKDASKMLREWTDKFVDESGNLKEK